MHIHHTKHQRNCFLLRVLLESTFLMCCAGCIFSHFHFRKLHIRIMKCSMSKNSTTRKIDEEFSLFLPSHRQHAHGKLMEITSAWKLPASQTLTNAFEHQHTDEPRLSTACVFPSFPMIQQIFMLTDVFLIWLQWRSGKRALIFQSFH